MLYAPLIKEMPNAKPLAQTLIEAAAAQGANEDELDLACELAKEAYHLARKMSSLSELEQAATLKLETMCKSLSEGLTSDGEI